MADVVGNDIVVDLKAERYASEERTYRYNVTSVITVASQQVEKILTLTSQQGELIAKGVTLVSGDYRFFCINYRKTLQ